MTKWPYPWLFMCFEETDSIRRLKFGNICDRNETVDLVKGKSPNMGRGFFKLLLNLGKCCKTFQNTSKT